MTEELGVKDEGAGRVGGVRRQRGHRGRLPKEPYVKLFVTGSFTKVVTQNYSRSQVQPVQD